MTLGQITQLYNDFKEREFEQFKNHARIQGATFKDDSHEQPASVDDEEKVKPGETPGLFGDPKAFEHLPKDERREMTQRMIHRHKSMNLMKG